MNNPRGRDRRLRPQRRLRDCRRLDHLQPGSGNARFGFVSQYKKGATSPPGKGNHESRSPTSTLHLPARRLPGPARLRTICSLKIARGCGRPRGLCQSRITEESIRLPPVTRPACAERLADALIGSMAHRGQRRSQPWRRSIPARANLCKSAPEAGVTQW